MKTTLWATQSEAIEAKRRAGWKIIKSKLAAVTFALDESKGRVWLMGWRGSVRVKASFFFTFPSLDRAEKYAAEFVQSAVKIEAMTTARKEEKKAKRADLKAEKFWTVGDVVHTSWGYDQTNVEFYQIVKVKPRSVVVRQVTVNCSDRGQPGGGKMAPRRFEFKGPEIACPLDVDGNFTAGPVYGKETRPSYRHHCSRWNGKAVYCSSDR